MKNSYSPILLFSLIFLNFIKHENVRKIKNKLNWNYSGNVSAKGILKAKSYFYNNSKVVKAVSAVLFVSFLHSKTEVNEI